MKKILNILCVLSLLFNTFTIVNAENISEGGTTTQMTYRVDGSYMVYIPEMIDITFDYYFEAAELNIPDFNQVNVRITNLVDDALTFTDSKDNELSVKIINSSTGEIIPNNANVAEFTTSTTSNFGIRGQIDDLSAAKAGDYTATAEFWIELGAREDY